MSVNFYGNAPKYIPCPVTNPAAVVTLHASSGTLILDYEYDPRFGFYVTKNHSSLHGIVSCNAVLGDVVKRDDILVIYESKWSRSPDLSVLIQVELLSLCIDSSATIGWLCWAKWVVPLSCCMESSPMVVSCWAKLYPLQKLVYRQVFSEQTVASWVKQYQNNLVGHLSFDVIYWICMSFVQGSLICCVLGTEVRSCATQAAAMEGRLSCRNCSKNQAIIPNRKTRHSLELPLSERYKPSAWNANQVFDIEVNCRQIQWLCLCKRWNNNMFTCTSVCEKTEVRQKLWHRCIFTRTTSENELEPTIALHM